MSTTLIPDDREHKLPVWAQDIINGLRREVRNLQEYTKTLEWDHPNTDMFLTRSSRDSSLALPKGESIRWRFGAGSWIEVRKKQEPLSSDVFSGKPYLQVYGDHQLIVRPSVTNVLHIFQD